MLLKEPRMHYIFTFDNTMAFVWLLNFSFVYLLDFYLYSNGDM